MLVYQRVDVKYDVMLFEIPACAVVPHLKKAIPGHQTNALRFFQHVLCFVLFYVKYTQLHVGHCWGICW